MIKLNKILKLVVVLFVFFTVAAFQVFAESKTPNILSKIVIEEDVNNTMDFNLVFNEKFTGSAFIQDRENGSYYIFIPETYMNKKGIKVLYRNPKIEPLVKINIEELPYVKNNINSKYIKISVSIFGNYSLQLLSKTVEEFNDEPAIPFHIDKSKLIATILLILACILLLGVLKTARKNRMNFYSTYHSTFKNPENIDTPLTEKNSSAKLETKSYNTPATKTTQRITDTKKVTIPDTHVLPKLNLKKSLKTSEGESFSCFDIPLSGNMEENMVNSSEFQNSLKQASTYKREKISQNSTTNPLTKSKSGDLSQFELPAVEDIAKSSNEKINNNSEKSEPELLSELRITPRKGFYLATVDNTFALFGFVDNNVYLLKKFSDLSQINLQARYYDSQQNADLYIVRLDSYKAMVEVSDNGIKEMAVL